MGPRVIILAAGQGKRLLPFTEGIPKALLDIGGKPLIERQIEAFAAHGVTDFAVVTGFAEAPMESELARIGKELGVAIATIFNPFYAVADNLASCWMARHLMDRPFIQVNGDNVFGADLVAQLLAPTLSDINVAINLKQAYDSDDMKVVLDGKLVRDIGKTIALDAVNAEAIGFYVFTKTGAARYSNALDVAMRDAASLKKWFPSVVAAIAKETEVGTVSVTGIKWCEVDFPTDLDNARQLVAGWN